MKTGNGTPRFATRWSLRAILSGGAGYAVMGAALAQKSAALAVVTLILWVLSLGAMLLVAAAFWLDGMNRKTLKRLEREKSFQQNT